MSHVISAEYKVTKKQHVFNTANNNDNNNNQYDVYSAIIKFYGKTIARVQLGSLE